MGNSLHIRSYHKRIKILLIPPGVILLYSFLFAAAVQGETPLPESVSIQFKWFHQFQFAGYYAAREKGFYAEEGLHVVFKERDPNVNYIQTVLDGDAEYGTSDASLLIHRTQGKPVVLLSQVFQHSAVVLIAKKESGVISPYELVGKTVMFTPSSGAGAALTAMFLDTVGDLSVVRRRRQSFDIDDLLTGKVDAMSAYLTDQPFVLDRRGVAFTVIDPRSYGIDFYGDNLFTTEHEVENHPRRVEKMIRATRRGWEYALDHQEEIIDRIVKKYNPGLGRAKLRYEARKTATLILPDLIPFGTVNSRRFERVAEVYARIGLVEEAVIPDGFIYKGLHQEPALPLSEKEKTWLNGRRDARLGIDPLYPPFEFFDSEEEFHGISSSYVQMIEEKLGLAMTPVKSESWNHVLEMARAGEIDVLSAAMKSEKRSQYLNFSKPHTIFPMVVLMRDDSPYIKGLSDMRNSRIATIKGYITEELLLEDFPGYNYIRFDTIDEALLALSRGNVDAYIDNTASISYTSKKLGLANLRVAAPTDYRFELAFGVRKDWPELISILNKFIDSIPPGEKRMIEQGWGNIRIHRQTDWSVAWRWGAAIVGFFTFFLTVSLIWNRRLLKEIVKRQHAEVVREKTARELREREMQLALAIESARLGMWDWNIQTGEVVFNRTWAEIIGYSINEIEQNLDAWKNRLHPDDLRDTMRELDANLQGKSRFYENEHRLLSRSGQWKWVLARGRVVERDAGGKAKRHVGICFDIESRKSMEASLIEAKEAAELSNRAKSRFIANMSHELRTPLNVILGFARLLSNDPGLSKSHVEEIDVIHRGGEHLLGLIDDILDISRIEAGRLALAPVDVDLYVFLQGIAEMFDGRARKKGLGFTMERDRDLSRRIRIDEGKLRQVLINLLGNAIKFTERGGVTLRAEGNKDARGNAICFEVEDTGVGIARGDLGKILDPFVQVGRAEGQGAGVGLGLAISEQLVRLMGGAITVRSEIGKGSIFRIEIPVELVDAGEVEDVSRPRRIVGLAPDQPRRRVLIVEDNDANRMLLRKMLETAGVDVREATNGKEGVEMFREWRPELVWMDMRMPVMDGYEATRRIKELERDIPPEARVRIIALTAHAFEEEREEIMAAGCDDFIRKPYLETEIYDAVARHLGVRFLYDEEGPAGENAAPPRPGDAPAPGMLAALPRPLLDELKSALLDLDMKRTRECIKRIDSRDSSAADALEEWVNEFRFEEMIAGIDAAIEVKGSDNG